MTTRIANWNVNHAREKWRREAIVAKLPGINAHIWILTETRTSISPGSEFECLARSALSPEHDGDESWVSIWSRLPPIASRSTRDAIFSTSATVRLPSGQALTVFGTVLPWRGRQWRELPSAGAVAFKAALKIQQTDWHEAVHNRGETVCVAGDFNQDLSDTPYYWSLDAHRALKGALEECDLVATTAGDRDPVRQITAAREACIDHICISRRLSPRHESDIGAWPPTEKGRTLSDHPGVWIDLADV